MVIVEIIKVTSDNSKGSAYVFQTMHTKEMLCRKKNIRDNQKRTFSSIELVLSFLIHRWKNNIYKDGKRKEKRVVNYIKMCV